MRLEDTGQEQDTEMTTLTTLQHHTCSGLLDAGVDSDIMTMASMMTVCLVIRDSVICLLKVLVLGMLMLEEMSLVDVEDVVVVVEVSEMVELQEVSLLKT